MIWKILLSCTCCPCCPDPDACIAVAATDSSGSGLRPALFVLLPLLTSSAAIQAASGSTAYSG
uniref:Uncharacterized protein n=1 Tax=Anguilla anguilla TaxID=7936 RepID=A0A0E9XKR1_ANGAN